MSNFFRKISQPLVVLVLVCAVFTGHVFAVEGDSFPSSSDVGSSAPADSAPDASTPDDAPDGSEVGSPDLPIGSYDTVTVSGADVTVNVEKHDTLSVASVPPDTPDVPDFHAAGDTETPTLAETIRTLFGPYTPRTQTVTTYYDGQPVSTDEQIVPGLAGLDFEWLAGVGMFALITFCLFRLLGGVLKHGYPDFVPALVESVFHQIVPRPGVPPCGPALVARQPPLLGLLLEFPVVIPSAPADFLDTVLPAIQVDHFMEHGV